MSEATTRKPSVWTRPLVKRLRRAFTLLVMTTAVVIAVSAVTFVTVDLGPVAKAWAERGASSYLDRPFTIGRLSFRLFTGRFVIEDVLIDGLNPEDRPFLEAGRIEVSLSWPALLNGEVLLQSVEMTDWTMLTESFPDGRQSFPRFTRDGGSESSEPRPVVTTLRYVHAYRGQFTFDDHGSNWSTVARNLDITVTKAVEYRGEASFEGGTVTIGEYVPMWADMALVFRLDGPTVYVEKGDLETDGARTAFSGHVDLGNWPEQLWTVDSHLSFPRMREIFFEDEDWELSGDGDFTGTFHYFKGGRELKGTFSSPLLGVSDLRFPDLRGALLWLPDRFEVTDASARMYGGMTDFSFGMAPLGQPTPGIARFDAAYRNVDLAALTDAMQMQGLRLVGRLSGRNLLEWPLGAFSEHRGDGRMMASAPPGTRMFDGDLRGPLAELAGGPRPDFDRPIGYLPIAGRMSYAFGPESIDVFGGRLEMTHSVVDFSGRTAYGEESRFPFHVISADWQEGDRVMAGLLTAFGSETSPKPFGGRGEFDGVMVGQFRDPRIEGAFRGEQMRAWDVAWGNGEADIVFENGYLDVLQSRVEKDGATLEADGRFALGYPRADGGQELDARFYPARWAVGDLRHAFGIDDYDLDGQLSGEFHLFGRYGAPTGFGTMMLTEAVAYGEPFQSGRADLRFESQGIRLNGIELTNGEGAATGAAFIGWDGSYSFNLDGRRLPLDGLTTVGSQPLTGLMQFTASGTGRFLRPSYDVQIRIDDLFWADEGIGQVTGRLAVRDRLVTVELEAASPRLQASATGRVAFTEELDADLTLRFSDTSLDPYFRPYAPQISPFTTAIGSGSIRLVGELANPEFLLIDTRLDQLRLTLFDYELTNASPVDIALDGNVLRLARTRMVGEDTELDLAGSVDLSDRRIDGRFEGGANLGVLQAFFRDIRSSGAAELSATIQGTLDAPIFAGRATITDGRLRHFAVPRSLEAVNGDVEFDARGARVDGVTARLGGGAVELGGTVVFDGYLPSEFNLTATGRNMALRVPEGVASNVDAVLTLTGPVDNPLISGTATVQRAVWEEASGTTSMFDSLTSLLSQPNDPPVVEEPEARFPLRFDVRILAPGTLEVDTRQARGVATMAMSLLGTYAHPLLFGQAEILRGDLTLEGRRYLLTRGTLDFANPTRIDPFIDVEAEANVRQPGQTYRVTVRATGTMQTLDLEFTSDPPLPEIDVVAMLLGDVRASQDAELRALQRPDLSEQELVRARVARLLGSPLLSEVGELVEETFGVDTFQITPLVGGDPLQQTTRFNPSARLTVIKGISDRVYLTYARSLNSPDRDQIVLIEFDQSNRLSWIFTRNEDETYSLDIRVRGEF